jgi:hypothetical protein
MKIKEIGIAWNSCELSTDVQFQCCLKFDVHGETPEDAYQKAIAAMRACLISEGAQVDEIIVSDGEPIII